MPAEGITPLTAEQRRDLMEIVDDRHDRASTIVTSQVPVELWHEHIGNPTIADAVLDRLVHGAHRLELKGESMRKLRAAKPGLTKPPSSSPTSSARDTHRYPAGIIGMPGWLRSEQVAGFDRNRWLQSSECAPNAYRPKPQDQSPAKPRASNHARDQRGKGCRPGE